MAEFVRKYKRTSRCSGLDPNDRDYDRKLEIRLKRIDPAVLDELLRDEDFEGFLPAKAPRSGPRPEHIHGLLMLPAFDERGFLPPGIHPAGGAELAARFGVQSELRRSQLESIGWMLQMAKLAGVCRIILNGSFVTDTIEPNDVDCVLLLQSGAPRSRKALLELRAGLPFLDMKLVAEEEFHEYVNVIYATDRDGTTKGVVELIQWN